MLLRADSQKLVASRSSTRKKNPPPACTRSRTWPSRWVLPDPACPRTTTPSGLDSGCRSASANASITCSSASSLNPGTWKAPCACHRSSAAGAHDRRRDFERVALPGDPSLLDRDQVPVLVADLDRGGAVLVGQRLLVLLGDEADVRVCGTSGSARRPTRAWTRRAVRRAVAPGPPSRPRARPVRRRRPGLCGARRRPGVVQGDEDVGGGQVLPVEIAAQRGEHGVERLALAGGASGASAPMKPRTSPSPGRSDPA